MRQTCFLLGFLVLLFQPARAGHSPPKATLRVHVQTTGEGQSAMEATPVTIPPDNEQITVRTLPEVTETDLVGVQEDPSGGVRLQFDHTGQVALSVVTAENQGRILVVLIDGFVVYAPLIDQQITSGELDIPHPVKPEIIKNLEDVAAQNVRKASRS
jgi:preprotein translocase subunit SecD